eukprot:2227066-Amphidinium_carterae.1
MPIERADSGNSPPRAAPYTSDNGRACQFVPRSPCTCHARVIRQDWKDGQGDDIGGDPAPEQLDSEADGSAEPAAVRGEIM